MASDSVRDMASDSVRDRGITQLLRNHLIWDNYKKEGKVLFNNALNTFYLRLYGVRHMVKDHFDSEKGNPAAAT